MINRVMATWLGVYLYRLLQSRDLDLMATHLNLRVGTASSTAITGGKIIAPELPFSLRRSLPAPVEPEPATTLPVEDQCPECGGMDSIYMPQG